MLHKSKLKDEKPIFQKVRRLAMEYNETIHIEVSRILDAGIIRPVESTWISLEVKPTNKDRITRFYVDYRRPNAVTKRYRWYMTESKRYLIRLLAIRFSRELIHSKDSGK